MPLIHSLPCSPWLSFHTFPSLPWLQHFPPISTVTCCPWFLTTLCVQVLFLPRPCSHLKSCSWLAHHILSTSACANTLLQQCFPLFPISLSPPPACHHWCHFYPIQTHTHTHTHTRLYISLFISRYHCFSDPLCRNPPWKSFLHQLFPIPIPLLTKSGFGPSSKLPISSESLNPQSALSYCFIWPFDIVVRSCLHWFSGQPISWFVSYNPSWSSSL